MNNSNGHFSQGFLLGALVGGAEIFLLGTKKGNKILKTLTEDGFEGLTNLIEEFEKTQDGVLPKPVKITKKEEGPKPEQVEQVVEEKIEISNGNGFSETHPRRFFKRK